MISTKWKEIFIVGLFVSLIVLFFYGLGTALFPLLFSSLAAYATLPIVKKLEDKGFSRIQATLTVLASVSIVVTLIFLIVLPPLIDELKAAIAAAPQTFTSAMGKIDSILSEYGIYIPYNRESLSTFVSKYSNKMSTTLFTSAATVLKNSAANVASILGFVLSLSMVPFFFFYVLKDYEKISNTILNLVPRSWQANVQYLLEKIDTVLSGYIRGQLLVCLILSCLYTIALLIVGIPFAIIIGILTGFLSIIPYVGFAFGFALAMLSALASFENMSTIVGLCIGYGIVQFIESFFVTPQIVGDKVGLSPFEAILALIVVGNLMGFVGLFLGIPIGAILKILIQMLIRQYKQTSIYKA
jgi:predicted PurR-regulated permease PerM